MFAQNAVLALTNNDITIKNDDIIVNNYDQCLVLIYNDVKLLSTFNFVASAVASSTCLSYYSNDNNYLNKIVYIKQNKIVNIYNFNYNITNLINLMLILK